MPRINFSWSPDYPSNDKDFIDVSTMEASVDYSIDVPEGTVITINDIYTHVDNWLRGCGFYLDEH